jgi:hypothetical protein
MYKVGSSNKNNFQKAHNLQILSFGQRMCGVCFHLNKGDYAGLGGDFTKQKPWQKNSQYNGYLP